MRVTDLTKHNSVLRNINANSERLQTLQTNMSSGRRINSLHDDPIGATQAQDFRSKLSFIDTIKDNIQHNYVILDRYEGELSKAGDLLNNAKTLILAQANGNADDATRRVTAKEIGAIIEGLMHTGNSKIGKLYIFSGTKTLTEPLVRNDKIQEAIIHDEAVGESDEDIAGLTAEQDALAEMGPPKPPKADDVEVRFTGITFNALTRDSFSADFIGFSRNPYVVRINKGGAFGRAHFVVSDDGGKSWSKERTLLRTNLVLDAGGRFDDRVELKFKNLQERSFDEPLIFPAGLEFHFDPNPPIAYRGNQANKLVPLGEASTIPINLTAEQVFFRHEADSDSIDIFDLLFTIQEALVENDQKVLEERLGELDQAYNQVLNRRADLGAVRKELELQFEKMLDRELTKIKQLSDVEDLDFQEAVVELSMAELRNQASLDTGGRLLQPSLLDFLR